jgi:hypothetical protein
VRWRLPIPVYNRVHATEYEIAAVNASIAVNDLIAHGETISRSDPGQYACLADHFS